MNLSDGGLRQARALALVATGMDPIAAMLAIERKDRHRALLPAGDPKSGNAIAITNSTRTAIMAAISDEWQDYTAFVGTSPGASKANVMATLSLLCAESKIEFRRIKARIRTQYRKAQVAE